MREIVALALSPFVAITLDPTVTIGNLISGGVAVAAVFGTFLRLSVRIAVIETKVNDLWDRRKARGNL